MSEKPHTIGPRHPSTIRRAPNPRPWGGVLLWTVPVWMALILVVSTFAWNGQRWMDALARSEPDPQRRQSQDGLRVARMLLKPRDPQAGAPLLWESRRSGQAAGFYLAGAVRAELLQRPDQARLWLALNALTRQDRERAKAWVAPIRPKIRLEGIAPLDPDWIDRHELGRQLRESLRGQR
jgi:hypothetical protein